MSLDRVRTWSELKEVVQQELEAWQTRGNSRLENGGIVVYAYGTDAHIFVSADDIAEPSRFVDMLFECRGRAWFDLQAQDDFLYAVELFKDPQWSRALNVERRKGAYVEKVTRQPTN